MHELVQNCSNLEYNEIGHQQGSIDSTTLFVVDKNMQLHFEKAELGGAGIGNIKTHYEALYEHMVYCVLRGRVQSDKMIGSISVQADPKMRGKIEKAIDMVVRTFPGISFFVYGYSTDYSETVKSMPLNTYLNKYIYS